MYGLFGRRYAGDTRFGRYSDWELLGYFYTMSEVEFMIDEIKAGNRDMCSSIDWKTYYDGPGLDEWEHRIAEVVVSKVPDVFEPIDVDD